VASVSLPGQHEVIEDERRDFDGGLLSGDVVEPVVNSMDAAIRLSLRQLPESGEISRDVGP
jgi:hypothetical protein